MRATRWTRVIGTVGLLGMLVGGAGSAWAQGGHLKVALQGDTSNIDLHLTTHYVSLGGTPSPLWTSA